MSRALAIALLALASCASAPRRKDAMAPWLEVSPQYAGFAPLRVFVVVHSIRPLGCSPVLYAWGDDTQPELVEPDCAPGTLLDGPSPNRDHVYQLPGDYDLTVLVAMPGERRPRRLPHTTAVR